MNQIKTDSSEQIEYQKVFLHWIKTSDEDYKAMKNLFLSKSYNWSLFVGHISIEKLLKAIFVKKREKHAPITHNLLKLADLCNLKISNEFSDWLDIITTFNINARYDDYKNAFYKTCSKEFSYLWIKRIREIRKWLKTML